MVKGIGALALMIGLGLFDSACLAAEEVHVQNPYIGANQYINHDYSQEVEYSIQHASSPGLAAKMRRVQAMPTAIWLDRIGAIEGGENNNLRLSLQEHLIRALDQQRDGVPVLVELVLYNLPNRDCSALSSNGTLDFTTGGLATYKEMYINVIAKLLEQRRFSSLRVVIILEPDSLPNMVTNLWHESCKFVYDNHVYEQGIVYAIERLSRHVNHYIYMDIGHSGWLGWPKSLRDSVAYFTEIVDSIDSDRGRAVIDGFVSNISGSTPTEEILLYNSDQLVKGKVIKSAGFYGWNPIFDEKSYIEALYKAFVAAGFSPHIKFLVDTSRNGWGGVERPQEQSSAITVNEYVDQSRIDRRFHRGNWCNPSGAGLGERPKAQPYGEEHPIAAFVWVKPPGESDGSSNSKQLTADTEGKHFDKMCDPNYVVSDGPNPSGKPTGALADAPASGHWFHEQFVMLIDNAYPPIKAAKTP